MLKSIGCGQMLGVNKLLKGKRENKAHKAQGSQVRYLGLKQEASNHCNTAR